MVAGRDSKRTKCRIGLLVREWRDRLVWKAIPKHLPTALDCFPVVIVPITMAKVSVDLHING